MKIDLTITNNTHDKAILNWTVDDTVLRTYNVYRRISSDTDGNPTASLFDFIGSTTDKHYEDDIKDVTPPAVPEIIKNTQVSRGEIVMNLKTRDPGTVYTYFVEAEDTGVSSYDAYATSIAGTKGYRYYVKPIAADGSVSIWEDDSRMIFQEGDAIILSGLEDGHYMFYAKSEDKDGNLSALNNIDFYIRNKYLNIEEGINQVPVGVRYNNRYRGPHESKKTDFMYMQIRNNLSQLKKRFTSLEPQMSGILVKPDYTNNNLLEIIEVIENKLTDTRREIDYENRNN
jgi:hypothetical protein